MAKKYFSEGTFGFLKDLQKNNNRDWFAANKSRYEEQLKDPALRLIEDFWPELKRISPHFLANPRSLFRIHRDVRFSKDKSPYKTTAGIHFRHEASKNAYAPGFYLHVSSGDVFVGCGIWHPEGQALLSIREHIAERPAAWKRASRGKTFADAFRLQGDRLTRPPSGFAADHPMIEDLKWKDFIGVRPLTQTFVTRDSLPQDLGKTFKLGAPFVQFLCDALGVSF